MKGRWDGGKAGGKKMEKGQKERGMVEGEAGTVRGREGIREG